MSQPSTQDIAIITDDPGWHGRQLIESFKQRGFAARFVRLQDCHFDLCGERPTLQISSFTTTPIGAFVRGVPGGSLEQVVYYLDVLHALEVLQVPVVNNTRSIERSVDKGMTSFLLSQRGIPTPITFVSSDLHYMRSKLRDGFSNGKKFVIKPLFGSQGKGLQLIHDPATTMSFDHINGVMYAQEYIQPRQGVGIDFRVFVVGNRVIASMKRNGADWISNVATGATVEAVTLEKNIEQLAIQAVRAVGLEYAGVDLIQDTQGKYWVTEVNSVPAWKGLQKTTTVSIADNIADDFLLHCKSTHRTGEF